MWAADLHGFYLEVEGEKAGKSLHTYANQLGEIMMGETGCGRSFMITCSAQKPASHIALQPHYNMTDTLCL